MQNCSLHLKESVSLDDLRLPSPPAVAIRILEAVKKQDSSAQELSRIICSDPALAVKILQMANSSMYSNRIKVSSIKKAITLMGTNALKNIALSFIIFEGLKKELHQDIDFTFLWRKSVVSAVASEIFSARLGVHSDEIFPGALLQNIGILVMISSQAALYREILEQLKDPAAAVDNMMMGPPAFDHREVGYRILKKWGLPEGICNLVRGPREQASPPHSMTPQGEVLFLANKLASTFCDAKEPEKAGSLLTLLEQRHQIASGEAEDTIESIQDKSLEILSFFDIDAKTMKSPSQILQEANMELGRLNLSYQKLVMELGRAKEDAQVLAERLSRANTHLRQVVYKDSLTGLYNHRYFQEIMDKELNRAIRYQKPISLILFDLDHFKGINDQYGHPAGDRVLSTVSTLMELCVRNCDSLARYGGEEFAVILPETDKEDGLRVGEKIRRSVEKMRVTFGHVTLRVTVSLGLGTWQPGERACSKSELISAADGALYQAKRSGRNRICSA